MFPNFIDFSQLLADINHHRTNVAWFRDIQTYTFSYHAYKPNNNLYESLVFGIICDTLLPYILALINIPFAYCGDFNCII